jgi:hypothetical protein
LSFFFEVEFEKEPKNWWLLPNFDFILGVSTIIFTKTFGTILVGLFFEKQFLKNRLSGGKWLDPDKTQLWHQSFLY